MRLRTIWKLEFSLIVADVERFRKKMASAKKRHGKLYFRYTIFPSRFLIVTRIVDMFTLNVSNPSLYSSKQSHIPLFILTKILILMIGPYEQTH